MELEYHSVIAMDQHLHGLNRRVDGNVTYSLQEIILVITDMMELDQQDVNIVKLVCHNLNIRDLLTGWLIGMVLLLIVTTVIVPHV